MSISFVLEALVVVGCIGKAEVRECGRAMQLDGVEVLPGAVGHRLAEGDVAGSFAELPVLRVHLRHDRHVRPPLRRPPRHAHS